MYVLLNNMIHCQTLVIMTILHPDCDMGLVTGSTGPSLISYDSAPPTTKGREEDCWSLPLQKAKGITWFTAEPQHCQQPF